MSSQLMPATLYQSYRAWKAESEYTFADAERGLLAEHLNLVSDNLFPRSEDSRKPSGKLWRVPLPGEDRYFINTLEVLPTVNRIDGLPPTKALVVLHGFGSGLALHAEMLASLAPYANEHCRVLALDWLGFGRSTRVECRISSRSARGRAEEAEAFFVDALEAWRRELGIETMTFVAHSLGGYLGTSYAMKYPGIVEHLVLVNPVGLVTQNVGERRTVVKETGLAYGLLHLLWRYRITPLDVVRPLGPLAGWACARYINDRIDTRDNAEYKYNLWSYSLGLCTQKGAKNALRHFLGPDAKPDYCLFERSLIDNLAGCKMSFIYGDDDWVKRVQQDDVAAIGLTADFHIISGGHILFLDQPKAFNECLVKVLTAAT